MNETEKALVTAIAMAQAAIGALNHGDPLFALELLDLSKQSVQFLIQQEGDK